MSFPILAELLQIALHPRPLYPSPFDLHGEVAAVALSNKIQSFLVPLCSACVAWAFHLRLNDKTLNCKYSECRLIQNVLTKSLIHLARGEVTDVSGEATLDAIENVRCGV